MSGSKATRRVACTHKTFTSLYDQSLELYRVWSRSSGGVLLLAASCSAAVLSQHFAATLTRIDGLKEVL